MSPAPPRPLRLGRDRLTATDADGNTTTYTYGVTGQPGLVGTMADPDGTVTTYSYNGTGQVTSTAVACGSSSATTVAAYGSLGRQYCSVSAYEQAKGRPARPAHPHHRPRLPATPTWVPLAPPTMATARVIQVTDPLSGSAYTGYDQAGEPFCTVAAYEAAQEGVTCAIRPCANHASHGWLRLLPRGHHHLL